MRRAAPAIVLLLGLAACRPFVSSSDPVAREQEILRDIKWRLAKDPRFDDVHVACEGRVVTLSGRVTTPQAAKDVETVADETRDVERVVNRLEIRPK